MDTNTLPEAEVTMKDLARMIFMMQGDITKLTARMEYGFAEQGNKITHLMQKMEQGSALADQRWDELQRRFDVIDMCFEEQRGRFDYIDKCIGIESGRVSSLYQP